MTWSRATKLVVVASTIVAGLAELYLAAGGWRSLMPFTIAATVAAAIAAVFARAIAMRAVLFVVYLAPATFLFVHGDNHFSYEITWLLPFMALLLVDRRTADWSIPSPWRLPLAWWALVVAVTWPIIALREVDFSRWLLGVVGVPNSVAGTSPELVLLWTLYVVLGHNLGILWIDALYRWYGSSATAALDSAQAKKAVALQVFRREIIVPLVAAAAISSMVGVYQATVDLGFLSGHVWPSMLRAAGTLMDANAFGMIVAMIGPAAVALAMRQGTRASIALSGLSLAIAFSGVWTSGSRSALVALLVTTGVMAYALWQERRSVERAEHAPARNNRTALIAAASIAVIIVIALVAMNSAVMAVLDRLVPVIPGMAGTTFSSATLALWQRNGYGSAAMRMIAEHPVQGVGVGAFHTLIMDYRSLVTNVFIGPDNAQNWWRHMVAEFGLLGSLPMLIFTIMFGRALFARSAPGTDRFSSWAIASPLIAFGVISMFSMPGQSATVILTFWTLAFWFLQLRGEDARPSREPAWAWIAIVALVIIYAGITLSAAYGSLLPRHRAERFGWEYSAGMSRLEPNADGSPGRRWANLRSMSTIPVKGRVLKFVAWVSDHPDADAHPLHVRVRADGKDYFDGYLTRTDIVRLDIPATPGERWMVVETWIDRTFRPSQIDPRSHDKRDLGLSVRDWVWE